MINLFLIGSGFFGLIVGSFLNVVVLRFGTGLSVSNGRSRCFSCNKTLSWYELIPLFSYIAQMGRCRHCESKISIQYPLVEVLTAGLFVVSSFWIVESGFSSIQGVVTSLLLYIMISIYIVIIAYDMRHKMIPDLFSYSVAFIALLFIFMTSPVSLMSHIISGICAFLFFFVFWFLSKGKWMGLGDGKLALSLGFLLGPTSSIPALLIAFWSGAIVTLLVLIYEKVLSKDIGINMKSEIPFAPFIIFGLLITFFLHINMGTLSLWFTL